MNTMNDQIQGETQDLESKYLTFRLEGEEYGVEILKVKEIVGVPDITLVPQTPEYIKGVINLRGKVVPVLDLRLKFNLKAEEYTDRTCLIVVETETKDGQTDTTGVIVDSVSEVVKIEADQIDPAPALGTELDAEYILGMGKLEDGVRILLDIDHVADSNDH